MTEAPRPAHPDLTAEFDEFYRTTRDRLLLQAFALTGDLTAARSGVRDAYVVAWHHWRKTSHAVDPEATVREATWRNALRRATARRWRRDRSFDAEACAILDELADLSLAQRKMLLLTQMAGQTLPAAAREVALPVEAASRELASGAAAFAEVRAIETREIPETLASLASATRSVRWPRVTIIRRAGAARRRAHTVVGAVTVVAALVLTGVVVTDSTGARPALNRETEHLPSGLVEDPQVVLPDTQLLPTPAVRQILGGQGWRHTVTNDNSEGDGRVLACQQERYVDPRGEAAWVRVFRDGPPPEGGRRLVQLAEASADERSAGRAYGRLRDWLAGCAAESGNGSQNLPQHRLVDTYAVQRVGNQAHLFLLRNDKTGVTYVTALARTGRLLTAVSMETPVVPARANRDGIVRLLATAVNRMCRLPAADRCAGRASLREVPAVAAGEIPAMLSAWDLPPAGEGTGPWVGPPAVPVTADNGEIGVVSCSSVSFAGEFNGAGFRHGRLRSFVLPATDLPVEFGLTQVVAALPPQRAARLVATMRGRVAGCPESDAGAGTEVRRLVRRDGANRSITAWQLRTDLPNDQVLVYDIAILRVGTAVSALLFVSVPRARMSDGDFIGLSERALERLGELPGYQQDG